MLLFTQIVTLIVTYSKNNNMNQDKNKYTRKGYLLLESAKELFFKHGMRRVSVQDICIHAGVSKMTFYRCFKNKTAIAKQIIESIYSDIWEITNNIIETDFSFEAKIKKIFAAKWKYMEDFGEEFLAELIEGKDLVLKKFMEEEYVRSIDQMRIIFQNAQNKGELRQDINIEFLLYMLNIIKDMLKDERLQRMYPDMSSLNKEVFNFFYYGILVERKPDAV